MRWSEVRGSDAKQSEVELSEVKRDFTSASGARQQPLFKLGHYTCILSSLYLYSPPFFWHTYSHVQTQAIMTYDWLQLRESLHAAKRDLESATNAATTPDGEGKDALKSAALSVDDAVRNVDKAVKNFSTSPLQPRPQLMHSGISPTPVVAVDNSPGQLSSTAKSDNTEGDTAKKDPNMKRNPHKRKKAASNFTQFWLCLSAC